MAIDMLEEERSRLVGAVKTGTFAVVTLWVLHILRVIAGGQAGDWGILPRRIDGLLGILTSPLAHGDFGHLANNSVPVFAGTVLLVYFSPRIAARVYLLLYVLTGGAVWLFARGAGWGADVTISHVGASGVAYALISFLFWFGVFRRSLQNIVVALIILFYFSGMIAGVLPDQLHVSWESHLFGGIVGLMVAWAFRKAITSDRSMELEPENYQDEYVLPPDTFQYTLAEREEMRRAALEAERLRQLEQQRLEEENRNRFGPLW